MAQGLSVHCFDVARGCIAEGMRVELYAGGPALRLIAEGIVGADALVAGPALGARYEPGLYELRFHVAAYYQASGLSLPAIPFLDVVPFPFSVDQSDVHYHFPFKMTPCGYFLFVTCSR